MIREIVPEVTQVAPQAEKESEVKMGDMSAKSTVIGITPAFIEILNYETEEGSFITADHYNNSLKVCVLGAGLANSFFSNQSALGKMVKVDDQWLEVVGVMKSKAVFTETVGELASRDLNNDVYLPLTTFNKRFAKENLLESEIKQITVRVNSSDKLMESAALIRSILDRHHFNNQDYT